MSPLLTSRTSEHRKALARSARLAERARVRVSCERRAWGGLRSLGSLPTLLELNFHSFIHSFIHLFSLPSRSVACGEPLRTALTVCVLFSLSHLSACFLSSVLVRFLLYGSNLFVLLMNSTVCFIICG